MRCDQGAGERLVFRLDRAASSLGKQGFDRHGVRLVAMFRERIGVRVESTGLAGGVIGADDQAGDGVAVVAHPSDVSPGVRGVGRVDADGCAVNAADRLVGGSA